MGSPVSDFVGDRVRQLRKSHGWNMEELADRCVRAGRPELTANALWLLEGGRRKDDERTRQVTVDELVALAGAFGRSTEDLLFAPDDCRRCHGEPPYGFTCNTCGKIGEASSR